MSSHRQMLNRLVDIVNSVQKKVEIKFIGKDVEVTKEMIDDKDVIYLKMEI